MTVERLQFDFLTELTALDSAKDGDPTAFAAKVRAGGDLSEEERAFIAECLESAVKPDGRATQQRRTVDEHLAIAALVLELEAIEDLPHKAVVEDVCKLLSCSKRTVQNALQTHRSQPGAKYRIMVAQLIAKRRHAKFSAKKVAPKP